MRRHSLLLILALLLLAAPAFAQVTGSLTTNDERLQGAAADGRPLVYSPDPVVPGSSISHWDDRAFPNLLMEPAINSDLQPLEVDLTRQAFEDIGWPLALPADVAETLLGRGEPVHKSAEFVIWAADAGFLDPSPFGGAPGNDATTLGEARLNLFAAVFDGWGEILDTSVPIDVIVFWDSLPCGSGGAALAAAGPIFIFNDSGLPFPDTWYHAAHAEAIAGIDATGSPLDGGGDIVVFMNVDIDNGCLGAGTSYYYGLDGNNPSNQVDVMPVILHELGHGLGFSSLTDEADGSYQSDLPSLYDHFIFDQVAGKTWVDMTEAERAVSARRFGQLAWNGLITQAAAQALLEPGVPELQVTAPASIAGGYDIGPSAFGSAIPAEGLTGEIACLEDGDSDGTIFNGCTAATNPAELAGKIALIDRGNCGFTTKAANAQAAGAIGAVIVNNAGNTPIGLGGSDDSITIPVASLGRADGNKIRREACGNIVAALGGDRFQVVAEFSTADTSGTAGVVELTDDTAYMWFFEPDNVEAVVKILNGCEINGHYWVFASGLTDQAVKITITDTGTGTQKVFENEPGPFQLIQDLEAFATCP